MTFQFEGSHTCWKKLEMAFKQSCSRIDQWCFKNSALKPPLPGAFIDGSEKSKPRSSSNVRPNSCLPKFKIWCRAAMVTTSAYHAPCCWRNMSSVSCGFESHCPFERCTFYVVVWCRRALISLWENLVFSSLGNHSSSLCCQISSWSFKRLWYIASFCWCISHSVCYKICHVLLF